jgi:hypothetical protein
MSFVHCKLESAMPQIRSSTKHVSIGLFGSLVVLSAVMALPRLAAAQTAAAIPPSITTPDKVESQLGTLDFKDGAPSKATLYKIYDDLDFAHAQRAFADTFQGVSLHAIRKGLRSTGSALENPLVSKQGRHK